MLSVNPGFVFKEAVSAPIGPNAGLSKYTNSQGNKPLSRKTEISMPQYKNHFLALRETFTNTSALIMALSIEDTISNKTKPLTVKTIASKSTITLY